MVPGIFAGLESAQIDYDAVAYRTSVILCEDPGWPAGEYLWEQYDDDHKDEIERMGLAISSTAPNILSNEKIKRFFNNNGKFTLTEEDYRSKVIFGDVPYYYNISMKIEDDPENVTGYITPDSNYGYMRRLVKLKDPGYAMIDSVDYNQSACSYIADPINYPYIKTGFTVSFDYKELQNNSIDDEYRFMPQNEPVSITIFNFSNSLESNVTSVSLTNVTVKIITSTGEGFVSFDYTKYNNNTYRFFIDDEQHVTQDGAGIEIKDADELRYEMYAPLLYSNEETSLAVVFNMTYTYCDDDGNIPHYYISRDFPYGYNQDYMTEPFLRKGVMEVLIW